MNKIVKRVLIGAGVAGVILLLAKAAKRSKNWPVIFASKTWVDSKGPIPEDVMGRTVMAVSEDGTLSHARGLIGKFMDENTIRWSDGSTWTALV